MAKDRTFRQKCPECHIPLHRGQHAFNDGVYEVEYCKHCGFKAEQRVKNKNL